MSIITGVKDEYKARICPVDSGQLLRQGGHNAWQVCMGVCQTVPIAALCAG